jgi:hypothetical protein
MATYVNNLRLKEITTGAESGTWGTSTNTNLELIADAFGSGTEGITTNADTHTTTIADGAADEGRAIFLKYTGTLDSACTITIAPNTVNKLWLIENATSGSQNIIISQGSGANITIGNGKIAAVFTDGAGSGAAVLDAFADLELSSTLTVAGASTLTGAVTAAAGITMTGTTPTLTIGDAGAEDTKIVFDGNAQDYYVGLDDTDDDLKIGLGSTVGTTPAITIDENQNTTISQDLVVSGAGPHAIGTSTNAGRVPLQAHRETLGDCFGSAFQSSVTTQGSDTIATVAQVLIKEPTITVGSGATVTNSAALYIYSAATEATNDYALWVDAGAVKFDSTLAVGGALTASGAINATSNVEIDGTLTLAEYIYHKADTDTYMRFQTNAWTLRTGGTDAISVNSSQDVTIGGDLVVSGTGPHAFGGAILDYAQFHFTGSFTSGGASTTMTGILGNLALTGASGDTGSLVGTRLAGSHATQTATESIGYIAQLAVEEPHITDNLTGDITVATTVYIKSAPTEGESNYALFVDAGVTRLDGNVLVGNTVTNPASGFSNQAGLGLVAATGNLEVSANNSVALELGRYGGTGNIQSFRYAGD